METILCGFQTMGQPVCWTPYGQGHINHTFLCTCDSGLSYILQRINRNTFRKPEELMENIAGVIRHLEKTEPDRRRCLHLVPTRDGRDFLVDSEGEYWRMYEFVPSSRCLQKAEVPEDLYQSGLAFGRFQQQLADYPVETLHETILNFHDTVDRYRQFHDALEQDIAGRAALCAPEIEFALAREQDAGQIVHLLRSGEIPTRVTHNDTKLNNVLMDYDTREALCVIDLDTVMPGSALYDYGDSIRFGASTAAEDETDLDKVSLDLQLFRMFTAGYLRGCGGKLTQQELELLPEAARLMTLECGIRFLGDYLSGDVYFQIHREHHNLDRARTQFRLIADMERNWDAMKGIVREVSQ